MSGGILSYNRHDLEVVAEQIDAIVAANGSPDREHFSPEVISRYKEAAHTARRAAAMLVRVDYLESSDDGPESFLARWKEEVPGPYVDEKSRPAMRRRQRAIARNKL